MATFLALTNRLLRRLNEVEIEQADFAAARGVQALAKDAINASIRDINTQEFEWPFNATSRTETTVVGQIDYDFPATLKTVKWDSFLVQPDDALNISGHYMRWITRDQYLRYLKNDDDNADPLLGREVPRYVFTEQGTGFSVTPMPDDEYDIYYEYFSQPTELSAYSDQPTIPDLYSETIIQGGLYHMYMFRDNSEQADRAKSQFDTRIGNMRTQLVNNYERIDSAMVQPKKATGGRHTDDYF